MPARARRAIRLHRQPQGVRPPGQLDARPRARAAYGSPDPPLGRLRRGRAPSRHPASPDRPARPFRRRPFGADPPLCSTRSRAGGSSRDEAEPELVRPWGPHETALRMLNNLVRAYLVRGRPRQGDPRGRPAARAPRRRGEPWAARRGAAGARGSAQLTANRSSTSRRLPRAAHARRDGLNLATEPGADSALC